MFDVDEPEVPAAPPTEVPTNIPDPDPEPEPVDTPIPANTPEVSDEDPVPDPLPTTPLRDIDVIANLLAEAVTATRADSRFVAKETAYLDCMTRETGTRSSSFEATLEMYMGSNKTAIDTCDDETEMFDTLHTVAKEELEALMDTPPVRGTTRSVLTLEQTVRNRYGSVFDSDDEEEFADEAAKTATVKEFAAYRSERLEEMRSSTIRSSRDVFGCLPPTTEPVATATVGRKLDVLSCVALDSNYSFWRSKDNFDRLTDDERGWVSGQPFDECTDSPDINVAACRRHDVALASMKRYVPSTDESEDFDEAWNPRNKYLADTEFLKDIATHACSINVNREWGISGLVDFLGNVTFCVDSYLRNHNLYNAFLYYLAVSYANSKDWTITEAEVEHAHNNRRFVACMPPTIRNVSYSNVEWSVTADWDATRICIDGIELNRYKFRWAIVTGSGETEHIDDSNNVPSHPLNETFDTFPFPGVPDDTREIKLYNFEVVPNDIASFRWFDGDSYTAPESFLGAFDTTAVVSKFRVDNPRVQTGNSTILRVEAFSWRQVGFFEYTWQINDGSSWNEVTEGLNDAEDELTVSFDTPGARIYRVKAVHLLPAPGIPPGNRQPATAYSRERRIDWVGDPPTPVPTPGPTGDVWTEAEDVEVGDRVLFEATYDVHGGWAYLDPSSHFQESSCSSRDDGEPQRGPGSIRSHYYACRAGNGYVSLRDSVNETEIHREYVWIDDPPPTPVPTPVPTGSITARKTTIEVGESVRIDATYDVHGTGFGRITFDIEFDNDASCTSPGVRNAEERWSDSIQDTLYGCSAGYGWVYLRDSHENSEIDKVRIRVIDPPPTPVPSGSIAANPTEIEVGESVRVTGTYDVNDGYAYIDYPAEFDNSSSCRSTGGRINGSSGSVSGTLYGCESGRPTIYLRESHGNSPIHSISVRVIDAPPTPVPDPYGTLTVSPTTVNIGQRVSAVGSYNVPGGTATIRFTAGILSPSSSCPKSDEQGEREVVLGRGSGVTSEILYGCRRGTATVTLNASTQTAPLHSEEVDVETPTPPHASNLRWTIGQTLISYSWTAPVRLQSLPRDVRRRFLRHQENFLHGE